MSADLWWQDASVFDAIASGLASGAGVVFGCLATLVAGLPLQRVVRHAVRATIIVGTILGLVLLEIAAMAWWASRPVHAWQSALTGGAVCLACSIWLAVWMRLVAWIGRRGDAGGDGAGAYVVVALTLLLGVVFLVIGLWVWPDPQLRAMYPGRFGQALLLMAAGSLVGASALCGGNHPSGCSRPRSSPEADARS